MDQVKKYLAHSGMVSIVVAETTELVENVRKLHDLTPTTTALLGRLVTVVGMMGLTEIKQPDDVITVQMNGNGPVGNCISVVRLDDTVSKVKACIGNPHIELPLKSNGKIDVGGALGKDGFLNIIKKNSVSDENYSGLVPLVSGEIAEDFTEYFAKSMQKPTAISLGVLVNKDGVKKAGGFLLNLMPDATDEVITKIENAITNSPSITQMLEDGLNVQEIAEKITGDDNLMVLNKELSIKYECDCNKEKFYSGISSLGKEEIKKIIEEDGKAHVKCQFCNKEYEFSKEELLKLIEK